MKDKIGKLFVFALLTFLASSISVSAKSYSLESDLDNVVDKYNSDTAELYVIGEYAFTNNNHTLTTQDLMLAARSIDLSGVTGEYVGDSEAYDAMTVFHLRREVVDYEYTGKWTVDPNYVGQTELNNNDSINIKYIDYELIQEDSDVDFAFNLEDEKLVSALNKAQYSDVIDSNRDVEFDSSNNAFTGKIYRIDNLPNWEISKQTGYYVTLEVKVPEEYQSKATMKLIGNETKDFNIKDLVEEDGGVYLVVALSEDGNQSFGVVVDFDGEGTEYESTPYTFDYSGVEFVGTLSNATVSATTEDQEVLDSYEKNLNIKSEDFLEIEGNKVIGNIHYNPNAFIDPEKDDKTDYYIPVIITVDEKHAQTATYTTYNYGNEKTREGTFQIKADNTKKTSVALLFTVKKEYENTKKKFRITIDLDGENDEYEPVSYEYDYSEAVFLEKPTSSASIEGKNENKEEYARIMNEQFQFDGNPDTLKVNATEDTITLSGQLVNKKYNFNGKESAAVDGYYFQYVIEISGDATNSSITIPAQPGDPKKIEYKDFDFKEENGVSGIVVLNKIYDENTNKKFDVTVDLDGNGQPDKTYHFDYSSLTLNKNSEVSVEVSASKVSEDDKTKLNNWGFPSEALALTSIEDNVVKGTIPYVEHISSDAFTGDDVTGNYMVYTIEIPEVNRNEAQIKLHCTTGENCQNGWKTIDAEKNSATSILHSVKLDENGLPKDIVAYVDLDGFSNNPETAAISTTALESKESVYLPYEIKLTFDKDIIIQKKSEASATLVTDETVIKNIDGWNGFNLSYQDVKLEDGTIKGKLYKQYHFKFDGTNEKVGYFLGIQVSVPGANDKMNLKVNGTQHFLEQFDVKGEENLMGLTMPIDPNHLSGNIVIEIDLDGDGTAYNTETYKIPFNFEIQDSVSVSSDVISEWNPDTWRDFEVSKQSDVKMVDGVIKGKLQKQTKFKPKGSEVVEGYYYAYRITVPGLQQTSKITSNGKDLSYDSFNNKEKGINTVVTSIEGNPGETVKGQYVVVVDLDGEGAGKPYTYTVPYEFTLEA